MKKTAVIYNPKATGMSKLSLDKVKSILINGFRLICLKVKELVIRQD